MCVFADKLMEETEELCLQREQKEVCQTNSFLLPWGRAGRFAAGLRAHQSPDREAVEPKFSCHSLDTVGEKRNKGCATGSALEQCP